MNYLVVGLGNIGKEYELTRHNCGFMVVDELSNLNKASFKLDSSALVTSYTNNGCKIYLAKPTTYMNLSGIAVKYLLIKLKIDIQQCLIISDDIHLPFGTQRLRLKGSSAGHNGLKNIEEVIGNQNFPRLKIGIGSDFQKQDQSKYVLSKFQTDQLSILNDQIIEACKQVNNFCSLKAKSK
jgi:PTH1 family peptidyl-tRNA hydrolase